MRSQGKMVLILILVLAALVLVALVSVLVLPGGTPVVAGKTILEIDLTRGFPDHVPEEAFARTLFDDTLRLREVIEALDRAGQDEDVVALVARVGAAPMGLATVQELRDALLVFQEAGKKMVAYADTLGEWGPSNGAYYLASVFDEIYIQPSGDVGLSGVRYEVPFAAGTLEKLGLEPQLDRRHEYKNAVNTYTEKGLTEPHREAMQALADSQFEQLVAGIADGRGITGEKVRELFDLGPYFGAEALEAGLVDGLAYRDEVYDALGEGFGEEMAFTELADYARGSLRGLERGSTIAVIYGVGGVVRGESQYDPLSGMLMGAETVAKAFRDAVEDPAVDAILFRVDSPGGSYVASDTIWRETVQAKDAGKPVVVSMGNVAASGGYFVSMSADRIVAQPGTITGSIGVYGGKIVSRGLWEKLGVSWGAVGTSSNSQMWSSIEEFGDRGWDRMQTSLDRIYDDFVSKVADGRGLPREQVEAVARGRIWTGQAALEHGLVDALGGYPRALAEVRELLSLEDDAKLRLKAFPRPRSTLELFMDRLPGLSGGSRSSTLVLRVLELMQRLGPALRQLGLTDDVPGPLRAGALEASQ
jgi:protease-4